MLLGNRTQNSICQDSLVAQLVKNPLLQYRRPWFVSWVEKIYCRRDRLPTPVFLGFPGGSAGKESTCNVGLSGFDPWVGNIPWRRERLPIHFRHFESKVVILAFFREY